MHSGKIVVQNLYKVFGSEPKEAIDLLRQGWSKEKILAERGAVIGVSDASFSVEEGEIFVLMGLSGSGKSTLIRLINRLIEPSAGDVFIDGQNVAKLSQKALVDLRRRDMSMVFQSFALMPTRRVLDNAAFGLEVAGMPRREREARAMEVLAQVGLDTFADKYPHELSGGMQQRVGLARALAVNPSMIIMDEAFSALDPLKRREMQDVLLDLQRKQQRTIIFVSHDIEEAMRIGSRIGIMEGGVLVQIGTPQELIQNPANDYVRAFFSTIDTSRYLTARQLCEDNVPLFIESGVSLDAPTVRGALQAQGKHYGFVLDAEKQLKAAVSLETIALAADAPNANWQSPCTPIKQNLPLDQVIAKLVQSEGPLPVIDEQGRYCGAISKRHLLSQLRGEAA
ncbi:glycine betaine/L-proline ABC transporter ATP-binding protein [Ventosimonas gracilis]|uniref:Quaternary amine transport ATP-binding protein n=1 Tax=Ventosimonas gracilis TaxID=1680762 RepID=A0A139SNI2_9GAMM|nr:glycine betaine/L-proline ABC transporter ATP-binding protein [Ventosimonas gracilis]KXU36135.1 glycine betaine/L-proline ABC transporter ATP-binding protein [Ventosimonas gracilis]